MRGFEMLLVYDSEGLRHNGGNVDMGGFVVAGIAYVAGKARCRKDGAFAVNSKAMIRC